MSAPVFPPGPWPLEWRALDELKTGMIAQLAGVAENVALSWISNGQLYGRGRFGWGNVRVDRDAFLAFAKDRGLRHAVNFLEDRTGIRIAYFGADSTLVLEALEAGPDPIAIEQFSDTFAFGDRFMASYPDGIVFDMRWSDTVHAIFILVRVMLPILERMKIPFIVVKAVPNEEVPPRTVYHLHDLEVLLPTVREALRLAG